MFVTLIGLQEFPWHPKALEELDDGNASVINEEMCLVYFTGELSLDDTQMYFVSVE